MNKSLFIKQLEKQKKNINDGTLVNWLNNTIAIIADEYPKDSQRFKNFEAIINGYHTVNIYADERQKKANQAETRAEAVLYIDQLIDFVNSLDNNSATNMNPTSSTEKHWPWGGKISFITFICGIIGGAFGLGIYLGNYKFDREKTEYYEQAKSLRIDTSILSTQIKQSDSIISVKDSIIASKIDSLKHNQETITGFVMLLKEAQEKQK